MERISHSSTAIRAFRKMDKNGPSPHHRGLDPRGAKTQHWPQPKTRWSQLWSLQSIFGGGRILTPTDRNGLSTEISGEKSGDLRGSLPSFTCRSFSHIFLRFLVLRAGGKGRSPRYIKLAHWALRKPFKHRKADKHEEKVTLVARHRGFNVGQWFTIGFVL